MREDDSVNKTALYYEKFKELQTVAAVARYFKRSTNTVKKYLEKHPQYQPPGQGNKLRKGKGRVLPKNTGKIKIPPQKNTRQVVFYCPQEIVDRLNKIESSETTRTKYLKALELYLSLKECDRPKVKIKPTTKDLFRRFDCPVPLFFKLDKAYKSELNQSKNDKIVAAIELFCDQHNV